MQSAVPFLIFAGAAGVLWLIFRAVLPAWLHATRTVAAWLTRAVLRRDAREWMVWAAVGAGLLAAIAAGVFFLEVAEEIRQGTPEIDRLAYRLVRGTKGDSEELFFVTFTVIGTPVGLGILAAIAAVFLTIRRQYGWVFYLAVTCVGASVLGTSLKLYFARARPDVHEALRHAAGFAFPSGHALGSTVVFGALAYIGAHTLHRWSWRSAALALASASILSVCLSRLYLGVHWLSDVAGGIAAGIVWLAATTLAFEVLRRFWRLRREV